MKFSHHGMITLTFLLVTYTFVSAINLPTTVQLDLVFPRNNVYRPTSPFPVVFALHNGLAAWPFVAHWEWEIMTIRNGSMSDTLSSGRYNPDIPEQGKASAPPDTFSDMYAHSNVFNTSKTTLFLRCSFGIGYACGKTTGKVPANRDFDMSLDGSINLHLDREKIQVPKIAARDPCPVPIGSIRTGDRFNPPYGWMMRRCPIPRSRSTAYANMCA
jgi:hypothetical protein